MVYRERYAEIARTTHGLDVVETMNTPFPSTRTWFLDEQEKDVEDLQQRYYFPLDILLINNKGRPRPYLTALLISQCQKREPGNQIVL